MRIDTDYFVDDILTPVLCGGNNVIEDYTNKRIILENWKTMVVEMYGELDGDYKKIYENMDRDLWCNLHNNLELVAKLCINNSIRED